MTITRVLVAPLNYSHRQLGQIDAFHHVLGRGNVREFDFMAIYRQGDNPNARLLASALEFQPDWIWLQVQGADIINAPTLLRIREMLPHCLITHWMGDLRLEVGEGLAAVCKATHATLISNEDARQHAMYARAGAMRTHYVQIGLDPEDLADSGWEPPFRVPDVVFCGGHYGHVPSFAAGTAERIGAIRALRDAGVDVGVVGPGWPSDIPVVGQCHVKQQVHVYRKAKVALSINHFNDYNLYYSDRHLIAMASGTPVAARWIPGLDREFRPKVDCLFWTTMDSLIECVTYLLGTDSERWIIGHSGRGCAIVDHTWRRRIADLTTIANHWHAELA